MNKRALGIGAALICLVMSGPAFPADTGMGINMFPPGNDGKTKGVGMRDGDDGNNYVFQTPDDNNGETIILGSVIYFNLDANGKVISVSNDSSLTTYQGTSARVEVGSRPDGTFCTFLFVTNADGTESAPIIIEDGKQAIIKAASGGGATVIIKGTNF